MKKKITAFPPRRSLEDTPLWLMPAPLIKDISIFPYPKKQYVFDEYNMLLWEVIYED